MTATRTVLTPVLRPSVRYRAAALVVLLATSGSARVRSQPLRFDRFTVEDGLSNNTVRKIYQDRKGFLWIATSNGLNRYDGYGFKVYRHIPGDSTSLSSNQVNAVFERPDGRLWIGGRGGLDLFDPTTGRFSGYRHDPDDPGSLSVDVVRAVLEDEDGRVWIGTGDGTVSWLDPETGRCEHYRHDPEDPASPTGAVINQLFEDRRGRLWVGTSGGGLGLLDRNTGAFTHFRHDPDDPWSIGSDFVASVGEDPSGRLVLGLFRGGVNLMDPDDPGRFTQIRHDPDDPRSLGSDNLRSAFVDKSGRLWAATVNAGLNRASMASAEPKFETFRHRPSDPHSLSDTDVLTILQDRSGILWFGTWRGGLNRWDPRTRQFGHVYHDPSDASTIGNNEVTSLLLDRRGTLWVGTWDAGLSRRNDEAGGFVTYRHDPDDPDSLPNDRILTVYEDRRGDIWIGTWAGGLARFDRNSERFERFTHDPDDPDSAPRGAIHAFAEDDEGRLWIGAARGISRMESGRFRHFDDASDPDLDVSAMIVDRSGTLWVGFNGGGLRRSDSEAATLAWYRHDVRDPRSLAIDFVLSLLEDRSGILWIGTSSGLDRLDPGSGTFTHFTVADGLPDETVSSIEEDRNGHLWFGTHRGLSRLDPATGTFRNFDVADGLQGLRFSGASASSESGHLYFGGGNGFNRFHPDSIKADPDIPTVVFTRLELPGTGDAAVHVPSDLSASDQITLSYAHRVFSLDFAALSFRDPVQNRYAYRFEGVSDEWIDLGTQHRLTFTGLSPATYRLHVRGSNSDGVWSREPAVLNITITPPWWRTSIALALYGLIGLIALYGIRRYELNRARLKNRLAMEAATSEKLRELDQEKSRFLANLSHEFRTPLTLIIGPLQKLLSSGQQQTELALQHDMMLRNARRLQRLINQVLDLSRLEAGHMPMNPRPQDLNALVRGVVQAMTPLAERESVTLSGPEATETVASFDSEHMEKVLGNLLSNALKFTGAGGRVEVSMAREGAWVEIAVRDTGIGIPAAQLPHVFNRFYQVDASSRRRHEGSGIGLALVKELVELHGGSVAVDSVEGEGSVFVLRLPIGHAVTAPASNELQADDDASGESAVVEPVPGNSVAVSADDPTDIDQTRILVVDDNADVRAFLRSLFEPDYRVFDAVDGLEGLECARSVLPDLVIADVMMPRLDGLELSRALKKEPMLVSVPVILLTARAGVDDEVEGLETGADHFVGKPFEPTVLQARVENLLAQRDRLRDYYSPGEGPAEPRLSPFVERLYGLVDDHLDDSAFSVEKLADEMALSPSQLRRRSREELDLSPNEIIRIRRLERAASYLEEGAGTISEVAYAVGFNSLHYFSRTYRAHFGVPPSEHLRQGSDS